MSGSSSVPVPNRQKSSNSNNGKNSSLSFARSPRRESLTYGSVVLPGVFLPAGHPRRSSLIESMTPDEREELLNQEQELLADNRLMGPPKHKSSGSSSSATKNVSSSSPNTSYGAIPNGNVINNTNSISEESTLLLSNKPTQNVNTEYQAIGQLPSEENENIVSRAWNDAASKGKIKTTYKRETVVMLKSSLPISLAFLLQYSLTVASIFCVGHIGKTELSAISVAAMVANICGYGVLQGLATSLDTLATQAFGRKDYGMVGFHTQKCTMLMFIVSVPISLVWWFSNPIFILLVGDERLASLASQYLRVLMVGIPGYTVFEVAKHYLQAQGIFHASTNVLIVCAPINLALNYILVWNKHIGMGFIGAPIAVVTTDYLMATLSILYVKYINGKQCWQGFSNESFRNWEQMARLGFAGVIALETEWLAFEILTLAAARLGTTELAAQTVLATIGILAYQIPASIGISASTRVGNLLGAQLQQAAVIASNTYMLASFFFGSINCLVLFFARNHIGKLFTSDKDVVAVIAQVTPVVSLYQINDCISAVTGGILRGQGRQSISGWANLILYYFVALPLGMFLAFHQKLGLAGIWMGIVVALFSVSALQVYFVRASNWEQVMKNALENDSATEEDEPEFV